MCRERALADPLMVLLREHHARLGLLPPADPYTPDPTDEVIRLASVPSPKHPHENQSSERTVLNPKKPGDAERMNPTTGESAGTVDMDRTEGE